MATPSKAARAARSSGAPAAITSRDNRWLKEFRIALRGGLPTETGFVGVEGVRLVEEALRSGCPIEAVLFSETGERHHERLAPLIDRPEIAIPILRTSHRLFEGVADTEHPQGVAALVKPRVATFDDLLRVSEDVCSPLLVVLAGVQDPGNVGAGLPEEVERSADARIRIPMSSGIESLNAAAAAAVLFYEAARQRSKQRKGNS